MSSPSASNAKSPLEAAQKIVVELTGMGPELQALSLKFAAETLGLALPTAMSAVATAPVQSFQPSPLHMASSTLTHK